MKTGNSTGTHVNISNNNGNSNGNNSANISQSHTSQSNNSGHARNKYTNSQDHTASSNLNSASNPTTGQYRYQFSNNSTHPEHQTLTTFISRNETMTTTNNSGYHQQKYINLNNLNNATNKQINGTNLQHVNQHHIIEAKASKTGRYPIELFSKKDMNNQQTKLLNSYRIQSAQNLAKQRSTGK